MNRLISLILICIFSLSISTALYAQDEEVPPEPTIELAEESITFTEGDSYIITFTITGWEVRPGGQHYHVLDGRRIIDAVYSPDPYELSGLAAGTYTLCFNLAKGNHASIGIEDCVDVTVTPAEAPAATAGDVNCDGVVTLLDVALISRYNAFIIPITDDCIISSANEAIYMASCDVTDDNQCTLFDALIILQCNALIDNPYCVNIE